ncbi:SAM-dependent methyltransferase [Amycolatopsis sp. NPDC051128]|uniref:SAM-dependent methyltransferase n=1 Tax=Amycolatopsis sp. NPDC051128 TaxID=3155412 RepID=UPI0034265BB2
MDTTSDAVQARARLWNLMLGGAEAYEHDRWLLSRLTAAVPGFDWIARHERDFVTRFWRFAAGDRGIRQFVHIGAPLPAQMPPHLRLPDPGRVVYVESDELLYRKGSVWMSTDSVDVVSTSPEDGSAPSLLGVLDVAAVIDAIGGRIDWLEPVAVIVPNLLSWADEGVARAWVTQVVGELAAGSLVATTHFFDPELPDSVVPIEQVLHHLGVEIGSGYFRRRADLERMFSGLTLETPGVTLAREWWPNGPLPPSQLLVDELLAVAVVVADSP